jgi:hypothetical protein
MAHLVLLQHGLHGKHTDFDHMSKKLQRRYGSSFFIHAATSNASILKTQDGIANAGNRLVEEVGNSTMPKLKFIYLDT